jgi:Tfp pilus assembly protein FimV
MRRLFAPAVCAAALLTLSSVPARALGFGATATSTTLGQPLDFVAALASDGDEANARECVAADVRVGEAKVAPENVRATIETSPTSGQRRVRVTTRGKVDEPVVTIDVTVGCASTMSRRFVAFVDPPTLRLAQADAGVFVPQRVESLVAPLVDIVNGARRSRRASAERKPAGEHRAAPGAAPVASPGFPCKTQRVQQLDGVTVGCLPASVTASEAQRERRRRGGHGSQRKGGGRNAAICATWPRCCSLLRSWRPPS